MGQLTLVVLREAISFITVDIKPLGVERLTTSRLTFQNIQCLRT